MTDIDNVNKEDALLAAWLLDGKGGGESLDWEGVKNWVPDQGVLWVHLDRKNSAAREWVKTQSGLDNISATALFENETRPRCDLLEKSEALLLTLRTVNLNPDENMDDMLSVRLWSDGNRIITTRRLPIQAFHDIDETFKAGNGPEDASDFVVSLSRMVTGRIVDSLSDLEEQAVDIEKSLLDQNSPLGDIQNELMILQRKTINLRRYIVLQPEVLLELEADAPTFMKEKDIRHITESAQKMTYAQAWINSLYDRGFHIQQSIGMRLHTRSGRTTYLLTIVAAIFLPLTFLTGLLGTNIGGIPGSAHPLAFWMLAGVCGGIVIIQLLLLRFLKWF